MNPNQDDLDIRIAKSIRERLERDGLDEDAIHDYLVYLDLELPHPKKIESRIVEICLVALTMFCAFLTSWLFVGSL